MHEVGRCLLCCLLLTVIPGAGSAAGPSSTVPADSAANSAASAWRNVTSDGKRLPRPGPAKEQTALVVLDLDNDGRQDFVVFSRGARNSVSAYRRTARGWRLFVIEPGQLPIEAGATAFDVDGDGDPDLVAGEDDSGNKIYWWENPLPDHDVSRQWARRTIKHSGRNKHHDMLFGDFDGDGRPELVFWNQGAHALFIAGIPEFPRDVDEWPRSRIYSGKDEEEGLAASDIDGDGLVDIVAGGKWFRYRAGHGFIAEKIGDAPSFSRAAAGQLKKGGRPEVVFVVGDGTGYLQWYEWAKDTWTGHGLLDKPVDHGHSLHVYDVNQDGFADIFNAEMRLYGANPDAMSRVFYGNGEGGFTQETVSTGFGHHESRFADLDGDGDLDLLGKPYNWLTPRLDIWFNHLNEDTGLSHWKRHVIDADRPWRAIFVSTGDMDGDGDTDIVSGAWWYENSGDIRAQWPRHEIGAPLNNFALLYDLDGDGDLDVLGTEGKGSDADPRLVIAENRGDGVFTLQPDIARGGGDFLQGVALLEDSEELVRIALSWHDESVGIDILSREKNQSGWKIAAVDHATQGEALTAIDIDGDGDKDLWMGTRWLEAVNGHWKLHLISPDVKPDRHKFADINQDGKPDAVVGFEAINTLGDLVWYENRAPRPGPWIKHRISRLTGPMSLGVADMDGDGDIDVVSGEHNLKNPRAAKLFVFENRDGVGGSWLPHLVYQGDEHHDGAQLADLDGDGDLDIVSIGWGHPRVIVYENLAR